MPDANTEAGFIFEAAPVPLAVLDAQERVVMGNPALCAGVGLDRDSLAGRELAEVFPALPDGSNPVRDMVDRALAGTANTLKNFQYSPQPAGAAQAEPPVWWRADCVPLPLEAGQDKRVLLRLEDCTEQVLALRKRDAFAAELQHRIGNLLTLVQIVARKTRKSSASLAEFSGAFESRIRALGRTHAFLSGANWDGMTVRQVLEQQIQLHHLPGAGAVRIDGPEWRMSVLHAQTFAMAVHELLANAVSFGALSVPEGRVTASWGHPRDGSYYFTWKETGLTGLAAPEKTGFGLQMLESLMPRQMAGKGVIAFTPSGLHYMLVVPENVVVPVGQALESGGT